MKKYSSIILMIFLVSCEVSRTIYVANILDQYIDLSEAGLLEEKGPPSSVTSNGLGGKIYTYDYSYTRTNTQSRPSYYSNKPTGLATPNYSTGGINQNYRNYYQQGNSTSYQTLIERKIDFYIDSTGYVYYWRTTGIEMQYNQMFKLKDIKEGRVDTTLFIRPKR